MKFVTFKEYSRVGMHYFVHLPLNMGIVFSFRDKNRKMDLYTLKTKSVRRTFNLPKDVPARGFIKCFMDQFDDFISKAEDHETFDVDEALRQAELN